MCLTFCAGQGKVQQKETFMDFNPYSEYMDDAPLSDKYHVIVGIACGY